MLNKYTVGGIAALLGAIACVAVYVHQSRTPTASASLAGCLIAGDSIAVDVGKEMQKINPECKVNAKIGEHTKDIVARVSPAKVVVLSAGSNDEELSVADLRLLLENVRSKAQGSNTVFWVLPYCHRPHTVHCRATQAVADTAQSHGDKTVGFVKTNDFTHPKFPGQIAKQILTGK